MFVCDVACYGLVAAPGSRGSSVTKYVPIVAVEVPSVVWKEGRWSGDLSEAAGQLTVTKDCVLNSGCTYRSWVSYIGDSSSLRGGQEMVVARFDLLGCWGGEAVVD